MRKLIAIALSVAFAGMSLSAIAGISPNTGGNAMTQSGAKIAPAKPAVEEKKEHQEEVKEQAK